MDRNFGEELNEDEKTKSSIGKDQDSRARVRGPVFLLSASLHSTPRFSVLREWRVGWGGVGWRTTGSGPACAVGDPGMLGFRVRAGQSGERNPDPTTQPKCCSRAVPMLTPPFPAETRIPHPRPPSSTLALTLGVGGTAGWQLDEGACLLPPPL